VTADRVWDVGQSSPYDGGGSLHIEIYARSPGLHLLGDDPSFGYSRGVRLRAQDVAPLPVPRADLNRTFCWYGAFPGRRRPPLPRAEVLAESKEFGA